MTLDAEFYRRSFLELYPRDLDWRRGVYDPHLGWDQPYNSNTGGSRTVGTTTYDLQPAEDVLRVVAIGNSFVFGSYVDSDETYPAQLETLLDNGEVLNMGVVGIWHRPGGAQVPGIRRAVRRRTWCCWARFPHNYIRTALPFYGYAKPVFRVRREHREPCNSPTRTFRLPQEVYDTLDRELDPPALYSLAFLRNRLTRVYWRLFGEGVKERYHEDVDRIGRARAPPAAGVRGGYGREADRRAGAARDGLSQRGGVAKTPRRTPHTRT